MNKEVLKMVVVLTIVAAVAATSLAKIYDLTKDAIAESKRQEMLRAIKTVLPPYDNEPDQDTVELIAGKNKKGEDVIKVFYLGRKEGKLQGIAFKSSTMEGYSGFIEVMVGVDPFGIVTAIEVLTHAETPGLGDKIVKPSYTKIFKGKSLTNAKWLVKKDGGEFDEFTGATISPRAVTKAVKDGLEFFKANKDKIINKNVAEL